MHNFHELAEDSHVLTHTQSHTHIHTYTKLGTCAVSPLVPGEHRFYDFSAAAKVCSCPNQPYEKL